MALIILIYKSKKNKFFPKVLLLDEIDAVLHPDFIKGLLEILKNMNKEMGIKFIMTTHNITTIAYSNEEYIYTLEKQNNKHTLRKQDKITALNILSSGFATLEEFALTFKNIPNEKLIILSEGNNVKHIKRAIEILNPELNKKIYFIENDKLGESQLKNYYKALSLIPITNKILFIFDCDVKYNINEGINIYYYKFECNEKTDIGSGIENLYPQNFIDKNDDYQKKRNKDGGDVQVLNKVKVLKKVLDCNKKEVFVNYEPLIEKIKEILKNI